MTTKKKLVRRQWLLRSGAAALGLGASLALLPAAWAQGSFPQKPIRIIEPLPAGGTPDVIARIYAEQLQRIVKQPVIVDNKPGGLYTVGLQALASAPADGHTLIHINVSMATIEASLHKFDMLKQLQPVTEAGETSAVLVSSPKAPFKTMKELVDYAKAHPGQLNYSVGGVGSAEHLLNVMIQKKAGFSATVVPYKGVIDSITAVMSGDVAYSILPTPMALQQLPKGNLRALAALSAKRLPQMPDVPTLIEAGVDVKPFGYWGGFAVAPGTPAPVVEYLRASLAQAVTAPEIQARLAENAISPVVSTSSAAFTEKIRDELARYTEAVKLGNLKFD